MADNSTVNGVSVSGGDTFRTDDNAGVKTPVSKIELGVDGSFDGFVASTNPLPVGGNTAKDGSGTAYAFLLDADGHTQVDVLSSALPSGAATAAKQPALGTAGTASSDVITVQGIASMTALVVDGSGVTQPVSGTVTANAGTGTFAVSAASLPLPSGASTAANQSTANTHLATIAGAVSGSEVQVDIVSGAVTVSGTVTVDSELTTADLDTGAGTDTRAVVGLVLAASGGGVLVGAANPMPISDNSGSITVDNGGTFAVQAAQSGTWTVQPGNTANTTAWLVTGTGGTFPVTDSGGSLTVDASDLDIRNLGSATDSVAAVQSGTWNVTNVSGTVSLPTGASTAANQATANTALAAIQTAVELLDNTVSGTELQVDVVAALPAGTNNIGDVDVATIAAGDNVIGRVKLSDGTDVADILDLTNSNPLTVAIVDGSGDQITSFGGGTQYTEDAAAAANPVGTALNLIRADTLAGVTSADGDNLAARGTDKGELYVKHVDAIPVTDNGGALTVDGTVAATQSGTWNVTDISGTVSLPTGAATAANQTTGNGHLATLAGAVSDTEFQVDVLTMPTVTVNAHAVTNAGTFAVQESGSALTALQLIDDVVYVDDADWTATTSKHALIGGVYQATPGSITDGDTGPLRLTVNGAAHVAVQNTVTVAAHHVTNAGTFAVQVDGSALTALQLIDDTIFADDAAFTVGSSKVNAVGFLADEASTDSVDEGDVGAGRMTLDRKQIVTPQPHTKGGLSVSRLISAASTNETEAKATAGQLYGIVAFNINAAARYIKVYDATAANVTVGTTTPKMTFTIPGNTAGAGFIWESEHGVEFGTALTYATTTGAADNDTGAVASAEIIVNLLYK